MNDTETVNRLVNENFNLARFMAYQYARYYGEAEALSIAMDGLLIAAQKYEFGRKGGLKFGTYAAINIRFRFSHEKAYRSRQMRGGGVSHIHLEAPMESGTPVGDIIADERAVMPGAGLLDEDRRNEARELLDLLSSRNRRIIELRFGFNGREPMTLEQLSHKYKMTREGVRQVVERTLRMFWRKKTYHGVGKQVAA